MIPTFILAIENDDDRAFIEHIYKEYYNLMYSKAYDILQNRDCVDDVINNACIKLIPKNSKTSHIQLLRFGFIYRLYSKKRRYWLYEKRNIASSWLSIDDETQDNILEDKRYPRMNCLLKKKKIERLLKALEKLPWKATFNTSIKIFLRYER